MSPSERARVLDTPHVFIQGKGIRTILLLHGTGGDENSLVPAGRRVDSSASLLGVRGKVLENGMARFFRRFAEGVFDIEDVRFRANELAEFVAEASREYGFSPGSVAILGYSNGANIGAALLLLRPESARLAMLFRPMLPLVPEVRPDLSGKSVFLSAGSRDTMIPGDGTRELERALASAGAQVTMNWEPSDHRLTSSDISKAADWLTAQPEGKVS